MAPKKNPHGKDSIIAGKIEMSEKVTIPAAETDQPWHKPKAGSVFPKKRRLVKSLMLKFIFNPDPHGKDSITVAKTETWEKVVEKVTIPAAETDQPWHKPKAGSVFPEKRWSNKSLMLKFIFNPGRVSDSRGRPPSG